MLPSRQDVRVVTPGKAVEFRAKRPVRQIGKVVEKVIRKLPPDKLAEVRSAIWRRCLCRAQLHRLPYLGRADLAKVQIRRQSRGSPSMGMVAVPLVGCQRLLQKNPEACSCTCFPGFPGRSEASRPVRYR